MSILRTFAATTLLYLSVSSALWAQASTSQISGVVSDSSGSPVSGAAIRALQTDTGLVRTTTAAADGAYVLTNLPIGPYTLEISKDGFNK